MIDAESSIRKAFDEFSKIENVRILEIKEKRDLEFQINSIIWEVKTEILFSNQCLNLIFHISFANHFPLEIPKIYLAPSTYDEVKYIPHVDTNRLICTFDSEIATTNPEDPLGIIKECLKRSKEIILAGLSGSNHAEFQEEFVAYWEGKYDKYESFPKEVLTIIETINEPEKLKLICLHTKLRIYNYVLHIDDDTAKEFKRFLSDYDIKFDEVDVFYLENQKFKFTPPFSLKNINTLDFLVSEEQLKSFRNFINNISFPKLVISSTLIKGNEFLFGWFHNQLNPDVKGFRPGKFKLFDALTKTQSNQLVSRITTDRYTQSRLINRSEGEVNDKHKHSITIGGVGSIGSNLFPFLNSFNFPEFKFIDKEVLKLENIGRHFLGFNSLGKFKSKALGDYAKLKNPLQIISTKEDSIINVINKTPEYINESDYLFISIGKKNIEDWLGNAIFEGIIKVPTFFLWVEPYLCAWHCIYINPLEPTYTNYFEEGYYKFNIISSAEYANNNSNLSLKEGGCQTTYVPYSASNIIGFLSCLFPHIASIIEGSQENRSKSYTWVGNTDKIISLGIELSEFGVNYSSGDLIENIL